MAIDTKLNQIIQMHHQHYEKNGDKELAPMLIPFDGEAPVGVFIITGFDSETGTDTIRSIIEETRATSYVFSSEAWMAYAPKGQDHLTIRPTSHPDRIECLVVSAFSPEGSCSKAFEIKRSGSRAELIEVNGETMWNRFDIYARVLH